jgi:hypothetical protein
MCWIVFVTPQTMAARDASWNLYDPTIIRRSKNIDQAVWEKFHDVILERHLQGMTKEILNTLCLGPEAARLDFCPS